jgi:Predicted membrane protein
MQKILERRWVKLIINAAQGFSADNCGQMAAALAYFAVLSAFPLLLLLVSQIPNLLALFSFDFNVTDAMLDFARTQMSDSAAEWLQSSLETLSEGQRTAGIVGVLTLFWSASGVFSQLDSSINRIWRVQEDQDRKQGPLQMVLNFARSRFFSFFIAAIAGLIMLTSGIFTTVLSVVRSFLPELPGSNQLWSALQWTVAPILGILALAIIYRFMPNTKVEWRDVWVGAIAAGLGGELLKTVVASFITSGTGGVYQSVAGPLALMIWVFFTSQIMFFGCELTRHYALLYGSRTGEQAETPSQPKIDPATGEKLDEAAA